MSQEWKEITETLKGMGGNIKVSEVNEAEKIDSALTDESKIEVYRYNPGKQDYIWNPNLIFKDSIWMYKISPREGLGNSKILFESHLKEAREKLETDYNAAFATSLPKARYQATQGLVPWY